MATRDSLSLAARGALLACVAVVIGALAPAVAISSAAAETVTFKNTGGEQKFVVPAGVVSVNVLAIGGQGATDGGIEGGDGAEVTAELPVTPGETLYINVGGDGTVSAGGFNGGAAGGVHGGGGGGATDIRTLSSVFGLLTHDTRILIAAGGGGAGGPGGTTAGKGGAGGQPGETESGFAGEGGTAGGVTEGGTGGGGCHEKGAAGGLGEGGQGGNSENEGAGGGGGGGLYGGGGGGGDCFDAGAGGGGGSSLLPAIASEKTAASAAQPKLQLTYTAPEGFYFTGGEQTFTVPADVHTLHVVAVGGHGGNGGVAGGPGGEGAQVTGNLSVTPGETLYVEVGGDGARGTGGFNGGGASRAGGGGGGTDIRTKPQAAGLSPGDRLIVASGGGGGGGPGVTTAGAGGAGGAEGEGESGLAGSGGTAGGASAGGAGGGGCNEAGTKGEAGEGGRGGGAHEEGSGGGGGGGLFGGGGGGGDCSNAGAGGGGGSSLAPAGGAVGVASTGVQPHILITYSPELSTPVVGGLHQSASVWRRNGSLAAFSSSHVPVGTKFSFTLNETASVSLSFELLAPGRKVHGHCVALTNSNKHKPGCTRPRTAGALTLPGHSGSDSISFGGRISAHRRLAPGSYAVKFVATSAKGQESAPRTLKFKIKS